MANLPKGFEVDILADYSDFGGLVQLGLSPAFAASVAQQPYEVLISCALALARFVVHLQVLGNRSQADMSILRRKLEFAKIKTIGGLDGFKVKDTDKTKLAKAYTTNPDLEEMERQLYDAESKAYYYDKLPDAIRDMINIIKYELRRKEQEREKGKLNAPV
jgi:hypothetical protein